MITAEKLSPTVHSAASPLHGARRLLRLVGLGGASLLLAAGAHTAGGGTLPGPGVLLVVAAVLGLAALAVTQRQCAFPLLLVLLGAQQVALHIVFTAAANAAPVCSGPAGSMGHHGTLASAGGCLTTTEVGIGTPMVMSGPGMWLGHAFAVVATAWLLARGEAWFWRTTDRIIRSATAAPTSVWQGFRSVRSRFTPLTSYAWTVISKAAPRGPPLNGSV